MEEYRQHRDVATADATIFKADPWAAVVGLAESDLVARAHKKNGCDYDRQESDIPA